MATDVHGEHLIFLIRVLDRIQSEATMGRVSIHWSLGELPKLEKKGVIEELSVDNGPLDQWLAEDFQKR
jgi:hypothetical protein